MVRNKLLDPVLTVVYPQSCSICERSVESRFGGLICSVCWDSTKIFSSSESHCAKCGTFLAAEKVEKELSCRRCWEDAYDKAAAIGPYANALMISVLGLKHSDAVSPRLHEEIINAFRRVDFHDATKIVPVPLSARRLRARGFNQAAVIARVISSEFGIAADEGSLIRNAKIEKHRMGMDRRARRESVKNIFEVARPKLIKGETILLVDDVFTTGATASGCAEVLKENGAKKVYVFTIARAM